MRTVKWAAFLNPDRKVGTLVHFLPGTPGAATPYPVEVALTVFGRSLPQKTISLDGARLFHPDGVRVEDIFTFSDSDPDSLIALQVEVFSKQQKSDVSASQCIVEFPSIDKPVLFSPSKAIINLDPQKGTEVSPAAASEVRILAIKDPNLTPSLLMINGDKFDLRPEVHYDDTEDSKRALMPLGQISPLSVLERKLDGTIFGEPLAREASWGNVRTRILAAKASPAGSAMYLLYRDVKTSKLTSVHAI
jgi:hypothetical protein